MQTFMNQTGLMTGRGDDGPLRLSEGCGQTDRETVNHDDIPHDVIGTDTVFRSKALTNGNSMRQFKNICAGCTRKCT
jgi:hypothetical protein